jgi:hypothetical protein
VNYPTENLIDALKVAIHCQSEEEKRRNGPNFESAFVAGMRTVKEALERGEPLRLT